jgi:hypothetical protein
VALGSGPLGIAFFALENYCAVQSTSRALKHFRSLEKVFVVAERLEAAAKEFGRHDYPASDCRSPSIAIAWPEMVRASGDAR